MSMGSICSREVVIAQTDESLRAAAELMSAHGVGCVVICDENKQSKRIPTGMLTDRDIVMAILHQHKGLDELFIGEAMSRDPLVIHDTEEVDEAIERLRAHGVRRAPVVDAQGALVGIVSLDDLLEVIAEQLDNVVHLIRRQVKGAVARGA
jgi:CBS domain-containing protein